MFRFALALLVLLAFAPALPAASIDREAAYRAALPLYRDAPGQAFGVKITDRKSFPDSRMTRFHYLGAGGHAVPALLFMPRTASPARPVPCLVVLHGLGGNKEMMAGFCRYLAAAGYASLAIDLYHHGERAPAARPANPTAAQMQQELATGIEQTTGDVRRGLDYLQTLPQINKHRLGIAGISLGAIIGTVAAGIDMRLKATALVSGGGGWGEILKSLAAHPAFYAGRRDNGMTNMDWSRIDASLATVDPLTFAGHIAPRSVLMINGGRDTIILPARADALYEAAQSAPHSRVRIERLPQAGHLPPIVTVFGLVRRWLAGSL